MAHHIQAIIARAPVDEAAASALGLPILIENGFAIFPLNADHADEAVEKLAIADRAISDDMTFDRAITLEFARRLGLTEFAIVETNYFGGVGEQWATVYRDGQRVMEPAEGGINRALETIGVVPSNGNDAFDTIGLGKYRRFDALFDGKN